MEASSLLGLPRDALRNLMVGLGIRTVHEHRLFAGLHRRRETVEEISGLGHEAARKLREASPPFSLRLADYRPGADGTGKLLFALPDGAHIEAVAIPRRGDRACRTLCVSSQVGCAMGCSFCATATLGLTRHLTAAEIVAQVYCGAAATADAGAVARNVVFMGMGEPLHNYAAVRDAIRVITDPHGLALAPSRVTVSTSGLADRIAWLGRDFGGRLQLAVSINAGTDATRHRLMPITARHDLASLYPALASYPLPPGRWLLLEYVLLAGVTDTREELTAFAAWARGLHCVINLIPFNPFPGTRFSRPAEEDVTRSWSFLREQGCIVTVRKSRGAEVAAACGQLALQP
ncbi:MAG: 23S rRNA (adenine(2503)-C(2))-methyltransferase RlmN [Candidatus Schekmanbacteria bacterium]|nr:23S rRNA (adenine(2503)-C(2))-methyltransferase RlmN [Candidatus Schekmanbacteria bacterium]